MIKASLMSCLLLLCAVLTKAQPTGDATLYNVNVIDVRAGRVLPKRTVVVRDGIIRSIRKAGRHKPVGSDDLSGKYLMPGLIDAHVHLGDCGAFGELPRAIDNYLAAGITTCRDCGGDVRPIIRYQDDVRKGKTIGPTIYYSSFWAGVPYMTAAKERMDTKGWATADAPWSQTVREGMTTADYERMVRQAKAFGCTGLKLYTDLTSQQLHDIIPVCRRNGVMAWGHAEPLPATVEDAVDAGMEVMSHIYLIIGMGNSFNFKYLREQLFSPKEVERRRRIFRAMKQKGIILDPTVKVTSDLYGSFRVAAEAYREGVVMDAGTDTISAKCIYHDELRLLHDSVGMTNADVLRAATINGARTVGQQGRIGEIRKGARADLLVLSGNPLDSLAALQHHDALYIGGIRVEK